MISESTAAAASAIQNACQTPLRSIRRESRNAAGTMMRRQRNRESIRDCTPFPMPSSAPDEVMEIEETFYLWINLEVYAILCVAKFW